ncbi:MAG: TrkA family potassium uptake protein [Clostridia bacterium]|nr:TrkA family potassium uptake protein [Clostridia bacterium]
MKSVLLIGLGHFGKHIAMKLNDLEHQILAVDLNEERIQEALPYVTEAQIGDSTNKEFLLSLGVRNFDVCIVTIGDDFQNSLETVWLLKELGAEKVIARASREMQEKFLLRNGADEVVYPEKQLASWMAIRCTSEHILEYVELDDDYAILELEVPQIWDGKTIVELDIRRRYGINVLGVRDHGKLNMDIKPDMRLSSQQSILVVGHEKAIHKCFHI